MTNEAAATQAASTTASPNVHVLPGELAGQDPIIDPEQEARELQALAEGVVLDDRVTCLGKTYRIRGKVGLMPLMRYAKAAKAGVDSDDMEGLAAIYDMLRDCIAPEDWDRFEREMTDEVAEADDLLPVVTATIEIINARPTRQPSVSSDGPSITGPNSTAVSSVRRPAGVEDLVPVDQLGSLL